MYINKALIYGNLTRDPEIKSLPSGSKVANFSVATNRVWKDKDGRKQESTEYHNIVTFARQAELVGQYLRKGSGVYIEGRLQTRSWDGQDGNKRYRTEIVADTIQFGPRGGSSDGGPSQDTGGTNSAQAPDDNTPDAIEYPEEDINPEDIPF
ncbi:MAG: single-stranded DNA-binding protein [Candidatus Zambryskibacteria bacterium CG10_big_fil_rev_8_21_14_0_10_42_12]|uniref:Single-stranded DNA-binding protein n=1 Tax=Candidatus Zambryskibacteria bacterium CG10_big_fil_rev_8_21_14_0_10_42_12 TaxID=1975115 RepID=A0A2H0QX11_9BACT|nr:MAG: single-stranded DNA-binding protein [Candidatus Zambryskibacteria bacterium CG10_big_fil_rev_8_21_14_0_10_42_12]